MVEVALVVARGDRVGRGVDFKVNLFSQEK